jgi:hypothetical protein
MTNRSQIMLSMATIVAVAGGIAPALASSDAFGGFRTMFAQPWHHKHIYRVRKPVPVKAKDDQSVALPPAPTAAPASRSGGRSCWSIGMAARVCIVAASSACGGR